MSADTERVKVEVGSTYDSTTVNGSSIANGKDIPKQDKVQENNQRHQDSNAAEVVDVSTAADNTTLVPFDYLIVIELGKTFEPPSHHLGTTGVQKPEIISVSWVVVNSATLEIIHKNQDLVRPENNIVTAATTSATGLTKDQLDDAQPLPDAIRNLESFMDILSDGGSKTTCFVTSHGVDLRNLLSREAKDKEVILAPYLSQPKFFDLPQEVTKWLGRHPESSLKYAKVYAVKEICSYLQVPVAEPIINGLSQCLTIVNILRYLLAFKDMNVFVNPIDTAADLAQFEKESSTVVHMSSLPADVTRSVTEKWFESEGLSVTGLHLLMNVDQKASSAGFAVLPTHSEAVKALDMNGKLMGTAVIDISPSSEKVLEATKDFLIPFPETPAVETVDPNMMRAAIGVPPPNSGARPGDWMCVECGYHNFASRRQCFKCNGVSPNANQPTNNAQKFNAGDWVCSNARCLFRNFASRAQCLKCGSLRDGATQMGAATTSMPGLPAISQYVATTPTGMTATSPLTVVPTTTYTSAAQHYGSWGSTSQATQHRSVGMGAPRPGAHGVRGGMRPGDWLCPSCRFQNFASRVVCFKCQTSKPATTPSDHIGYSIPSASAGGAQGGQGNPSGSIPLRAGDWYCPNCNTHNFASRVVCMSCKHQKPAHIPTAPPVSLLPGDWLCPNAVCRYHNFARRKTCVKCNTAYNGS